MVLTSHHWRDAAFDWKVFLNGEDVSCQVILADDERGLVYLLKDFREKEILTVAINDAGVVVERKEGKVEIFCDGKPVSEIDFGPER